MEKTSERAAQVWLPIFPQLTKIFRSKIITSSGFTLLEVIITVALIALISALVIPKISNRNNDMRSMVRKIAVLNRDLKSRAKLNNATYRLVINMGEGDGGDNTTAHHEFWVERAQGEVLNNYDPKNPPKLQTEEDEKKEEASVELFTPDLKVMKQPEALPGTLQFESVELGSQDEPITSGLVYIHYLPTGYADEAAIHLKVGEKLKWTLAIEPLTGRLDIIDEYRSLEDLRAK